MAAPTSVEDYFAVLPEEMARALENLRRTIRAAAPEAREGHAPFRRTIPSPPNSSRKSSRRGSTKTRSRVVIELMISSAYDLFGSEISPAGGEESRA